MNKVILTGRLTRDPESRMTQSNMEISRFSLACQSDFVSRDGERETEFINCVAFNRSAQTINRYCRKGQMILVQGRIRNSSYDAQDGTKRYTTDVVVDNFEFLGSRNDGANAPAGAGYSAPASNNSPITIHTAFPVLSSSVIKPTNDGMIMNKAHQPSKKISISNKPSELPPKIIPIIIKITPHKMFLKFFILHISFPIINI